MMKPFSVSSSSSAVICCPKFPFYTNQASFLPLNEIRIPKSIVRSSSSRSPTRKLLIGFCIAAASSSSSSSSRASIKCYSQKPSAEQQQQLMEEVEAEKEEVYEFERLFSNLNQATLSRDPGSLSSAISLVAGTTIGAGILAIPTVTQEAGFLASAVTCIFCWIFMVVTGLLIAEVNVKTMCEMGSGGVSLVSMAMRTLGSTGVQVACWSYIFIHYALLVAYVARSSDILTNFSGLPLC